MLFNLYRANRTGVHFLQVYTPMTNTLRGEECDRTVYDFKAWGKGADRLKAAVACAAEVLGCSEIVAVPSSGEEIGNNALLTDSPIRLVPKHARTKRHNDMKVKLSEKEERARIAVEWDGVKRGRILLADDVCTTGTTLKLYAKLLVDKGVAAEVATFALGHKAGRFERVAVLAVAEQAAPRPATAKVLSVEEVREAAFWSIQEKQALGKKLTAADYDFLKSYEGRKAAERATTPAERAVLERAPLDLELEEYIVRDGVVGERAESLASLAGAHSVPLEHVTARLVKVQRMLLKEYGFDGHKRSGTLSGDEALALQLVKSIRQLNAVSRQCEMQIRTMERRREGGEVMATEEVEALMRTVRGLCDKRDGLVVKVRELALKERKSANAKAGRGNVFQIVVKDGPLAVG